MSDNSLFLNVEHKTSENLTTEVFKYILISEEYSDCQKIIYNMIFPNDNNLDTKGLSFSVESQSNLGKSRPDCVIKNKHMIIAIENKFYAPFTNDDQIHRYCSELQKLNPDIKKYLVLLTLKDMKNYYENEIIKQFKQQEKPLAKNLDQIFKDRGMTYKTVLWDDLFVDFKSDDVIIRNLRSFIAKKYLKRTILDE